RVALALPARHRTEVGAAGDPVAAIAGAESEADAHPGDGPRQDQPGSLPAARHPPAPAARGVARGRRPRATRSSAQAGEAHSAAARPNPGTTYQSAGDPSRPASAPATATAHIAAASTWKARIRSSIPNGTKCAPTTSSVHTGESSGASREVCSSRLPTAIRATSTAITRPNQPGCGRGGAVSVPPAGSGARSTETRTPAPATRNP